MSQVFYSPIIKEAVDSVSQIMGLPRSHILPMKNYESEMELDDGVNTLALMTLLQVLRFADDYMYNYLDLLEEGKLILCRCHFGGFASKLCISIRV
jgi:hypothetical protein